MRAVAWHGKRDVRVDTVDDPRIEQSTDAIVRITSTGICGSDLHLYEVLGAFMEEGDILGMSRWGSWRRSALTWLESRLETGW
jgi:threonine dehydrogenase-like Zn-dependent dehydrogenase